VTSKRSRDEERIKRKKGFNRPRAWREKEKRDAKRIKEKLKSRELEKKRDQGKGMIKSTLRPYRGHG
jgi:hypothetical protein